MIKKFINYFKFVGILKGDLFLYVPNIIGFILGIVQIIVYFKYNKTKKGVIPEQSDIEATDNKQNTEDTSRHSLSVNFGVMSTPKVLETKSVVSEV